MHNCAVCHGGDAKWGWIPWHGAMSTPPPDLTLIAVRNNGAFPKAQVLSSIDGYAKSDMTDGRICPNSVLFWRGTWFPMTVATAF